MRRLTLTLSLALGLIASLALAATATARPIDLEPPGVGSIATDPVAASAAPSPFQLTFDGARRAAKFPTVGEVQYDGPFTASAPFCASGHAVDVSHGFGRPITAIRTYTCDDGSGSFTARVERFPAEHYVGGSGQWRIVAGTGRYAELRGAGSWTTVSASGSLEDVATASFRTTWQGLVAFDDVAPELNVSRATAQPLRPTGGAYRLGILFLADDGSDGTAVSYRLTVRDDRGRLAMRTGEATSGLVFVMLPVETPKKTQRVTVEIAASDPLGNGRTITRSVRLPSL
jgi:hypothetical protein